MGLERFTQQQGDQAGTDSAPPHCRGDYEVAEPFVLRFVLHQVDLTVGARTKLATNVQQERPFVGALPPADLLGSQRRRCPWGKPQQITFVAGPGCHDRGES
ncbi:MAG: hypothetical protein V3W34_05245 [Phycisphaerae bacterium]